MLKGKKFDAFALAEVENLAQDKCQQILHDRREALANKVRRRA